MADKHPVQLSDDVWTQEVEKNNGLTWWTSGDVVRPVQGHRSGHRAVAAE